jgi:hypothetical protein
MPYTRVDAGCMNAYEHFVVSDLGSLDVSELENIGGAIAVLDDRLHWVLRTAEEVDVRP